MLYLLDSNILIYARVVAAAEHEGASKWLTATLKNKEHSVAVCETSLLAFLRITTNPKAFQPTLPLGDASEFIRNLLDHPRVRILRPTAEHYGEVLALISKHDFEGNLVMDAHLAVLANNTGATLVTNDKDFNKIPYLKTYNPLSL